MAPVNDKHPFLHEHDYSTALVCTYLFNMRFGVSVPAIFRHVLALLRSSQLPQALSGKQKWRSRDFVTCISFVEVFPAAAGSFFLAKKTFL